MNELIKKWNKSSGEVWKDAWKTKNIGSSLSGIIGGLTNVISSGVSNTETKSTAAEESLINNVASTQFGEGNLDTLLSDFNSNALAESNYSGTDLRGLTTGQQIGNTLKGIGSGAIAGAKVGGIWGALAGGVIGLGSGIIGSAIGNKRAKDKAIALNRKAEEANASYLNNYSNSVENTQNTMFNNSLLNVASYGGPLYELSGDWTNGLTFINAGGTHEQNPFEGVQIGVDPRGIPNLVEEGEVIWNDYVFSNRLKPTKKQLEDNGLNKKYEGWTFAKIVEDIQKESADNPIDFISQNTLEDNLNTLTIMQEDIRMKKQSKENIFADGGWQSLFRYTPVVANSAALLNNIFAKPDYSNVEAGLEAMRDIPVVNTTPIGNYLQLDSLDRNYYLNPILASSKSTARAIQNQGLNAGQTIAGLMSNQYNTNKGIGEALFTMDRENMARDLQEAQFNLGIDQYNANQAMQAKQMNQQRAFNIAQAEANAGQMREAIDAQRTAAISQSLTGLSTDLAGIGTEANHETWLQGLIDSGAIKDYLKGTKFETTTNKNGGKLLTKKRK